MHPQSTNPTPARLSDDEFSALFAVMRNADLARQLGVSVSTVTRRARALGLSKDPETRYAHMRRPKSDETRARMSAGMKGRTFSDETRAKMSAAQTGRTLTPEWRENISKATKGKPKPPGYAEKKRGVPLSEEHRAAISRGNKAYRAKNRQAPPKPWPRMSDERYRPWRLAVLQRDEYTCQQCGRVFIPGQRGLHAHHLKPYSKHLDVRYDVSNGSALCTRCHRSFHTIVHVEDYERIEQVPCACGCGQLMYPIAPSGRARRFIRGHVRRGAVLSRAMRSKISTTLSCNDVIT